MKLDYKGCRGLCLGALLLSAAFPGWAVTPAGASGPPPPGPSVAVPPQGVAPGSLGPFLGVLVEDIPDIEVKAGRLPPGVRIMSVVAGSPAAGVLREEDVLQSIAGQAVSGGKALVDFFASLPVGRAVPARVRRDDRDVDLSVTPSAVSQLVAREENGARALVDRTYVQVVYQRAPAAAGPSRGPAERPPAPPSGVGFLGVSVEDNPAGAEHDDGGLPRGAMVRSVLPGSAAAAAGVAPGDVITWASGRAIGSAVELTAIVSGLPAGTVVQLVVQRNGAPITLNAQLAAKP